jgi:hypothetical protein
MSEQLLNEPDSYRYSKIDKLKDKLINIYHSYELPDTKDYIKLLNSVNETLSGENSMIRPYSSAGKSGGLIYLKQDMPTIIVPDIHARVDFFYSIMFSTRGGDQSVLERIADDRLQVVCVGDGFHAESRAINRWSKAFSEYKDDFKIHTSMDFEMRESLSLMQMVMEVKVGYPDNFHFIKGNHENILNEFEHGNYPFRKFAAEGAMVLKYVEKFYGKEFLNKYSLFEKNLPLLAVGRNFLISHAEPKTFFSKELIIEYADNPEVIKGLTWTDNNEAENDSVIRMLKYYLSEKEFDSGYYFGGHRPVSGLYNTRSSDRYVQIHNPAKFIIAFIKENDDINLNKDIIEIEKIF